GLGQKCLRAQKSEWPKYIPLAGPATALHTNRPSATDGIVDELKLDRIADRQRVARRRVPDVGAMKEHFSPTRSTNEAVGLADQQADDPAMRRSANPLGRAIQLHHVTSAVLTGAAIRRRRLRGRRRRTMRF